MGIGKRRLARLLHALGALLLVGSAGLVHGCVGISKDVVDAEGGAAGAAGVDESGGTSAAASSSSGTAGSMAPQTGGRAGAPVTGGRAGAGVTMGGTGNVGATGGTGNDSGEGGEPGTTGGTSGGGGKLDLEPACRVFCDTWLGRCATAYDTNVDCAADCIASYEGVREECRRLAAPYLECAGATENCQFGSVPQSCSAQVNALRECVFGNPPVCEIGIVPSVEGCDVMALCDGMSVLLGCDGENDGSGTSLCDCQAGGEVREGILVDGIGLVACSNALLQCAQ